MLYFYKQMENLFDSLEHENEDYLKIFASKCETDFVSAPLISMYSTS